MWLVSDSTPSSYSILILDLIAIITRGNPYASFCSPGDFCVRRDFLNHPVYGSFKVHFSCA